MFLCLHKCIIRLKKWTFYRGQIKRYELGAIKSDVAALNGKSQRTPINCSCPDVQLHVDSALSLAYMLLS